MWIRDLTNVGRYRVVCCQAALMKMKRCTYCRLWTRSCLFRHRNAWHFFHIMTPSSKVECTSITLPRDKTHFVCSPLFNLSSQFVTSLFSLQWFNGVACIWTLEIACWSPKVPLETFEELLDISDEPGNNNWFFIQDSSAEPLPEEHSPTLLLTLRLLNVENGCYHGCVNDSKNCIAPQDRKSNTYIWRLDKTNVSGAKIRRCHL